MPLGCLPRGRPALLSPKQLVSGFQKDSSPSPAGVEILQAGRTLGAKEMMLVLKASSSGRCCSVAKSCLTLCDSMDYNPPGSSVHGILPVGTLE